MLNKSSEQKDQFGRVLYSAQELTIREYGENLA